MTDLPATPDKQKGAVTQFSPQKTVIKNGAFDGIRKTAEKIKDWPTLEVAVDDQMAEQTAFVAWWNGNVGVNHGGDRGKISELKSCSVADAQTATGISPVQVSRWRKSLSKPDKYREQLLGAAYRKAMMAAENHRAEGTGENEWYTPDQYLEAARDVLGSIDLDPASSDAAQKTVRAARYFTRKDNGLKQKWLGRVWLNPPYTQPDIAQFVSKMVSERHSGNVTGAIMLTHNYTDTAWFHEAAGVADAICFTRGRIKFYDAQGDIAACTQGQAFFYFGDNIEAFASRFNSIGFILIPHHGEI